MRCPRGERGDQPGDLVIAEAVHLDTAETISLGRRSQRHRAYQRPGSPVISVDVEKKEPAGNFKYGRSGADRLAAAGERARLIQVRRHYSREEPGRRTVQHIA